MLSSLSAFIPTLVDPKEIIADMQAAFVCFLIGQVYDAFEHWKQWVNLLCHCEQALQQHPDLFLSFMSTLCLVVLVVVFVVLLALQIMSVSASVSFVIIYSRASLPTQGDPLRLLC
jgi:hypothetical protein